MWRLGLFNHVPGGQQGRSGHNKQEHIQSSSEAPWAAPGSGEFLALEKIIPQD